MRVYATVRAKVVSRGHGVELIELQCVFSGHNPKVGERDRGNDSAFPSANGAVASTRIDDAIRQMQLQDNSAALAAGTVSSANRRWADFLDHVATLLVLPNDRVERPAGEAGSARLAQHE